MAKKKHDYKNFDAVLSFDKLINQYRNRVENSQNRFKKLYFSALLQAIEKDDFLSVEIEAHNLHEYADSIHLVLAELFPESLTNNEIKAATIPFSTTLFNCTRRLENLLKDAGEDFDFDFMENSQFNQFRLACGIILNKIYNQKLDIGTLIHCEIPDKNGNIRTYRITFNADFVEVIPKNNKPSLDKKAIDGLLRAPDDENLWRSSFPQDSYRFEGFGIISLTDVTVDAAISDLKTILLNNPESQSTQQEQIEKIFQKMFNLDKIHVGFTSFDQYDKSFERMLYSDSHSYMLGTSHEKNCENALCSDSYNAIIKKKKPLIIPDVVVYADEQKNKFLTNNLLEANLKSVILYPVTKNRKLLGVLEIGSEIAYALNSFNATRIDSVIEYIKSALVRAEDEYENRIKAIIQTECTSIHPSVQWKFEKEARRILKLRSEGQDETFKDIRFQDVYPLYGQIDVVGSSDARNNAIKEDLSDQLVIVCEIFEMAKKFEDLPIYDQISFRVFEYRKELTDGKIDANAERSIIKLLTEEINPIMDHLKTLSPDLKNKVVHYQKELDPGSGVIYKKRNNYDNTVQTINEALSRYVDKRQVAAQKIYTHFFERFKTDGVEHNIYVGKSIQSNEEFNPVYLYNLRLWQLQTMIEMEDKFYRIQENLPSQLDAASMILVFDNTLSIRYRIDEKRFDVDGTYNARYEVIKKRIDKAHIKGTEERVTQKGTISIIYTNKENEREYMRYVNFLQHKDYLGDKIERLELEDVQGVIGLKALRINILYGFKASEDRMTYADLIQELHLQQPHNHK
ncbi:GAF domain-containing protein [Nonlabens ponticola]|uniref:GAF domain-containing protein n=1 Tax=Nonlabens ponticola TaxID=2496866 RepID=A0A3S9MYK1_9FLAO|nr:GAF domain-containing protein [Nonlabens ponticola]AZQ44260.1 GAF domain-containing protein [Nonlabens ponticola]